MLSAFADAKVNHLIETKQALGRTQGSGISPNAACCVVIVIHQWCQAPQGC